MLRSLVGMALLLMMSVPASAVPYRDVDEPEHSKHPVPSRSGWDHDRFGNYDDRNSFRKDNGRHLGWRHHEVGGNANRRASCLQAPIALVRAHRVAGTQDEEHRQRRQLPAHEGLQERVLQPNGVR